MVWYDKGMVAELQHRWPGQRDTGCRRPSPRSPYLGLRAYLPLATNSCGHCTGALNPRSWRRAARTHGPKPGGDFWSAVYGWVTELSSVYKNKDPLQILFYTYVEPLHILYISYVESEAPDDAGSKPTSTDSTYLGGTSSPGDHVYADAPSPLKPPKKEGYIRRVRRGWSRGPVLRGLRLYIRSVEDM